MPAISNGIEFEVNYNKTKCCFRVGGVMSFFLFLFFFVVGFPFWGVT